jgi:hypothetical protein
MSFTIPEDDLPGIGALVTVRQICQTFRERPGAHHTSRDALQLSTLCSHAVNGFGSHTSFLTRKSNIDPRHDGTNAGT